MQHYDLMFVHKFKICFKICYLLLSIKFLFEVHGMIVLHLLGESGYRLSFPPLLKKVTVTINIVYWHPV